MKELEDRLVKISFSLDKTIKLLLLNSSINERGPKEEAKNYLSYVILEQYEEDLEEIKIEFKHLKKDHK